MSFRRRRGMGGSSWPWSRSGSGDGGEAPTDRSPGEEPAGPSRRGPAGGGPGGGGPGDDRPWWRRRELLTAVLVVALFAGGYVAAARLIFPVGQEAEAGEVVQVPDLVGLAREEADRSVTGAGLALRVQAHVPHPEAPAGAVVAQTPLPGQYARPGAPIQVTLSSGPERRRVPDLRGLSDRQGAIVLERLGFRSAVDSTRSPAQRGQVVGTRPDPGQELDLPAEVTLLVSEGPRTAEVPDLSGRHVEDVPTILRDAGLDLGDVTYEPDAFQAAGRVIAQSPPPGYALRRGGAVSIRVAGSPPPEGGPDGTRGRGDADTSGTIGSGAPRAEP